MTNHDFSLYSSLIFPNYLNLIKVR